MLSLYSESAPTALDLNVADPIHLFNRLARHLPLAPFSFEDDGKYRHHFGVSGCGFGDVIIYLGIPQKFKAAKIFEVGSGSSSVFVLDTLKASGLNTVCIFIDPYPARLYQPVGTVQAPHTIIETLVQHINLTILDALEANEILFINSLYVVNAGSDVHFEITAMLPRLKPGGIVRFRDVYRPFNWGNKWVFVSGNL